MDEQFARTPAWLYGRVRLASIGLLGAMAKEADYSTWFVRISERSLARITKTKQDTVARHIAELVEAGALTVVEKASGRTPVYRINHKPPPKSGHPQNRVPPKSGHYVPPKTGQGAPKNGALLPPKTGHISEAEKPRAAAEAAAANLSWEGEGKSQLAAALGLHPGSLHALLAAIRSDAYLADLEHDPARLVEIWGRKALRSARAAAEADTARRTEEARRRQPRPKPEPPCTPRTTKRFRSIVAPPPAEAADPGPDTTTPADPDTTRDRHPSQFGLQAVAV